jgi:hypothetical protein
MPSSGIRISLTPNQAEGLLDVGVGVAAIRSTWLEARANKPIFFTQCPTHVPITANTW